MRGASAEGGGGPALRLLPEHVCGDGYGADRVRQGRARFPETGSERSGRGFFSQDAQKLLFFFLRKNNNIKKN